MSCNQVRRELLEHFALGEELGSRSVPHLAHLESCADCRREVGIDRALVEHLRRALRYRVEGKAPSDASWQQIRRRTLNRPRGRWTVRAMRWGGMVSAVAAAGVMIFAVSTTPENRLFPGTQSAFVASGSRRDLPVEVAADWPSAQSSTYRAPQTVGPLPGWPMQAQLLDAAGMRDWEPPTTGHMR